jgi:hypothetical protein
MTKTLLCLFLICFGGLHAQPVQSPAASAEKLNWKTDHTYKVNPHDTAFGFYEYRLRSLSYEKGSTDIWTISLPERMQQYVAASIYDKSISPDNGSVLRKFRFDEIDFDEHQEFLKCPALILNDVIAVADASGFLLLDKKDGAILADIPGQTPAVHFFSTDSGRYDIRVRNTSCSGFTQHGAEFTALCSGYLFHFNGSELFVFDQKHRLRERIGYSHERHGKRSKGASYKNAFFNEKKYKIEITGVVYLK